ncbi:DMT family transporter [Deltaproteobacteria bacterium OttesenSCG-928-K17]|nr:DMT family transporter [Deltaproteobacteria bacterium OttesenSCG-928-K17]
MSLSSAAKGNLALSLAAFFWGTTFIFQRQAMDNLTPLAYGSLRFTLGGLCLLPMAVPRALKLLARAEDKMRLVNLWLMGGLVSGGLIFIGITFQQYGLLWTTAGKAGFITSLYVVLVPLILRLAGHRISIGEGLGALLAVVGLYFLSFTAGLFSLSLGDGLVLVGSFIWAGHVIALGWLAPKMDGLILGTAQALVCGLLGLAATTAMGQVPAAGDMLASWLDILWGGFFSVALGFTFQVIGQKSAKPAPAAIIMQMEAVIAVVAGWLCLDEIITVRMFGGIALMLAGMMVSQLWPIIFSNKAHKSTLADHFK